MSDVSDAEPRASVVAAVPVFGSWSNKDSFWIVVCRLKCGNERTKGGLHKLDRDI